MRELWLNFIDERGEAKRILVAGERFSIGRTPENDLQLPISNLSRRHVEIERYDDVYTVEDCGSSNGTTLNGDRLSIPITLRNGDILNLGDAIEIKAEFAEREAESKPRSESVSADSGVEKTEKVKAAKPSAKAASAPAAESSGLGLLILAPIAGLFLLLLFGGVVFLLSRPEEPDVPAENTNFSYKDDIDEEDEPPVNTEKNGNEKVDSPTPVENKNSADNSTVSPSNQTTPKPEPIDTSTPVPRNSDENEKIELASAAFLRQIAQNDPKAFLTGKQISVLKTKISSFKGAGGLAENIRNAKKNSGQIASIAQAKNLKPLFLTCAALAKLGSQRGDVLATAQSMAEPMDNLSIVIGNERADDNLLVIAAFNQGVAGENLKLRDTMAKMTKEFPNETPRNIRTIWFLSENKKITAEEFEFALRFLAIGTITQNPKDFNVQAEALSF